MAFHAGAVCIKRIGPTWKLKSVRLGETNLETEIDCSLDEETYCADPVIDIEIIEAIVHKNYRVRSSTSHFNIALLRLARSVKFSDFVRPICLPLNPSLWEKDFEGYTFGIAGKKLCST